MYHEEKKIILSLTLICVYGLGKKHMGWHADFIRKAQVETQTSDILTLHQPT